jgi:hypothetical protein
MIVLLPNCGSSGDSPDKACAILAKAQCDRRLACTNAIQPDGVFILNTYGDMSMCLTRQHEACVNNATAPGTGTSPAQLEKCASEYASWLCADLFDGNANPPPDCAPAGKLANGQACAMAGQCASRFCSGTKNASCGLCADEPLDGASCTTSGCAPGQACKTETNDAMVCRDRLLVGDMTCTTDTLCQAFSTCVGASATKTGVCTPTSSVAGRPVRWHQPGLRKQSWTRMLGQQPVPRPASKSPMSVTRLPAEHFPMVHARSASTPIASPPDGPAAATDTDATCVAQVADGTACDTQFGPLCLAPARCVTSAGTTGICTVPNATSCK